MFEKMGFTLDLMFNIGILEVIVAIIFVLPGRLGLLGTVLLTGYLGGAVVTHVRVGDQFFFPIIVGAVAWGATLLANIEFRKFVVKGN